MWTSKFRFDNIFCYLGFQYSSRLTQNKEQIFANCFVCFFPLHEIHMCNCSLLFADLKEKFGLITSSSYRCMASIGVVVSGRLNLTATHVAKMINFGINTKLGR